MSFLSAETGPYLQAFLLQQNHSIARVWYCSVWEPSPERALKLRYMTVLIHVADNGYICVNCNNTSMNPICTFLWYLCAWLDQVAPCSCTSSSPSFLQKRPAAILSTQELLLQPCGGLLTAGFSQFKPSSLTTCAPFSPHLPFGGGSPVWGLGGCSLSHLRGARPAPAT